MANFSTGVVPELASLSGEDRARKMIEMKQLGFKLDRIATMVGLSVGHVRQEIRNFYSKCAEELKGVAGEVFLVEDLTSLDELIRSVSAELSRMHSLPHETRDPISGARKTLPANCKINEKVNLVRLLADLHRQRRELLVKTGIMPVEPEKMEHSITSNSKIEVKQHKDQRSRTEMEKEIFEIARRCASLN